MRVRIVENAWLCAKLRKDAQNLIHIAALLAARIEFAVRVSAGAALAKRIIALRIYRLMLLDAGDVLAALVDVLAALQEDGAEAEFDQMQSCKEAGRPRADHDHAGRTGNIAVADRLISHGGFVFINKKQDCEIDEDPTLARVDALAQKAHSADGRGCKV